MQLLAVSVYGEARVSFLSGYHWSSGEAKSKLSCVFRQSLSSETIEFLFKQQQLKTFFSDL